jgi:hypothetical protein
VTVPKAEIALLYDPETATVAEMAGGSHQYRQAIRGVHRTLWEQNIPIDMVTPGMDWSGYKVVYLPNLMMVNDSLSKKIVRTLETQPQTHFIADGLLGNHHGTGRFSYDPPEGLSEALGVKVYDYTFVDKLDLREGRNQLVTDYGRFELKQPSNYVSLVPTSDQTHPFGRFGDEVVAVQTANKRFSWITFTLGSAFGGLPEPVLTDLPSGHALVGIAPPGLLLPLLENAGVQAPVETEGSKLIVLVRGSAAEGRLLIILNLEDQEAKTKITLKQGMARAVDLLEEQNLPVAQNRVEVNLEARGVKVLHCLV